MATVPSWIPEWATSLPLSVIDYVQIWEYRLKGKIQLPPDMVGGLTPELLWQYAGLALWGGLRTWEETAEQRDSKEPEVETEVEDEKDDIPRPLVRRPFDRQRSMSSPSSVNSMEARSSTVTRSSVLFSVDGATARARRQSLAIHLSPLRESTWSSSFGSRLFSETLDHHESAEHDGVLGEARTTLNVALRRKEAKQPHQPHNETPPMPARRLLHSSSFSDVPSDETGIPGSHLTFDGRAVSESRALIILSSN